MSTGIAPAAALETTPALQPMGDLAHAESEYSRAYELWPSEDVQKKLEAVRKRKGSEASKTK